MESKETKIIELFFNEPTKHWHFEDILKTAKISRPQAAAWLNKFIKEGIVKKIKEKGKMPHYLGDYENPNYQIRKRIFAMNQMAEAGFLQHLIGLQKAKTVIIFGSFTRGDWYKESDIDLFVYGDAEDLKIGKYELKLHRDIQVFVAQNKKDLNRFGPGLLRNIIKGDTIKGTLPIEVIKNAGIQKKEKAYDECIAQGYFKPQEEIDAEKIAANLRIVDDGLKSIKILRSAKGDFWNSVYRMYYDSLHLLVEALLRFDKIKSSNHQCLFSYLCVKHPELELDWNFFEKVRTKRNGISYYGQPVSEKDLKEIELQTNLYISTLKKEIEKKLKQHKK